MEEKGKKNLLLLVALSLVALLSLKKLEVEAATTVGNRCRMLRRSVYCTDLRAHRLPPPGEQSARIFSMARARLGQFDCGKDLPPRVGALNIVNATLLSGQSLCELLGMLFRAPVVRTHFVFGVLLQARAGRLRLVA